MTNKFIVVEQPNVFNKVSTESIYETLSKSYLEYNEINQAFKQLERGFEAYDILSGLKSIIKKQDTLTPALESSLNKTVLFYRDILEDYSTNISLENYSDNKIKRSIALEGIGDWLSKIWKAIINFFKRIWNWLTGKKESPSSSSSKVEEAEKSVEEAKKSVEEARKKREEADKKHADFLKKMERAKNEQEALEIEARRKEELEEIKKRNKITQDKIARQLLIIEKLEKEKRDKEALEEIAKKIKEEEKQKKIAEEIKAKEDKIAELITRFNETYSNNINKLRARIPGHDRAASFFVAMEKILSYLSNQISNKIGLVENYIDDLPRFLKTDKHSTSDLAVGFSVPSGTIAGLERWVSRRDSEVRNFYVKEAYKEEMYLFDNKVLAVTSLYKIDYNVALSTIKAPIAIEQTNIFLNKKVKFDEEFYQYINVKFLETFSRTEKNLANVSNDWTTKVKKVTDFIEQIEGIINNSFDEYGEQVKTNEIEKHIDAFKEKSSIEHDEEYLDEKRKLILRRMKVIMEDSKTLTSAFPIADFILSNTIEIFKIINENNVYSELAKELKKIKPANKFG